MKTLLLLLVFTSLSTAQINVTLSMVDQKGCQDLFAKSLCKNLSLWVGTLHNASAEPVGVGQAAVLSMIPQLRPLTLDIAQILAQQGQSKSVPSVIVDFLGGGSTLGAAVAAGQVKASAGVAKFLTSATLSYYLSAFMLVEPYVAKYVAGHQTPILRNFIALEWAAPIQLSPGSRATFHIFTSQWSAPPAPLTFQIDMSRAALMRVSQ